MKAKSNNPSTLKWILVLLLPLQYLLFRVMHGHPQLVEDLYSNGIYLWISALLRWMYHLIPFSVGDLLYALLGIWLVQFAVVAVRKVFRGDAPLQYLKKELLNAGALLSVLYGCFLLFWGFNYLRQPLEVQLQRSAPEYSDEDLLQTTQWLAGQLYELHDSGLLLSDAPLHDESRDATMTYAQNLPAGQMKNLHIKKSLFSKLIRYQGVSGYYNPFTAEAQYDNSYPNFSKPFVICHELAHQLGYAFENEANYIGFRACLTSDLPALKYAGLLSAFRYCYNELYFRNSSLAKGVMEKVHPGVKAHLLELRNYYKDYRGLLNKISSVFYDNYLKLNQTDGLKSYNYVVSLIVSDHLLALETDAQENNTAAPPTSSHP